VYKVISILIEPIANIYEEFAPRGFTDPPSFYSRLYRTMTPIVLQEIAIYSELDRALAAHDFDTANSLFDLDPSSLSEALPSYFAQEEDLQILSWLASKGLLTTKHEEVFPLVFALSKNNAEAATLIMDHTRHCDYRRVFGNYNVLHLAALYCEKPLVERVFRRFPHLLSEPEIKAYPPVHLTCLGTGNTEVIKYLLSLEPRWIKKRTSLGESPTHIATASGNTAAALLFVQKDPNSFEESNIMGACPFHLAAQYGQLRTLLAVINEIHKLTGKHSPSVTTLLQTGLKDFSSHHRTPLHYAAQNGHTHFCDWLLSFTQSCEAKTLLREQFPLLLESATDMTAPQLAAINRQLETTRWFVKKLGPGFLFNRFSARPFPVILSGYIESEARPMSNIVSHARMLEYIFSITARNLYMLTNKSSVLISHLSDQAKTAPDELALERIRNCTALTERCIRRYYRITQDLLLFLKALGINYETNLLTIDHKNATCTFDVSPGLKFGQQRMTTQDLEIAIAEACPEQLRVEVKLISRPNKKQKPMKRLEFTLSIADTTCEYGRPLKALSIRFGGEDSQSLRRSPRRPATAHTCVVMEPPDFHAAATDTGAAAAPTATTAVVEVTKELPVTPESPPSHDLRACSVVTSGNSCDVMPELRQQDLSGLQRANLEFLQHLITAESPEALASIITASIRSNFSLEPYQAKNLTDLMVSRIKICLGLTIESDNFSFHYQASAHHIGQAELPDIIDRENFVFTTGLLMLGKIFNRPQNKVLQDVLSCEKHQFDGKMSALQKRLNPLSPRR
jgi:ankyrin repeat protein